MVLIRGQNWYHRFSPDNTLKESMIETQALVLEPPEDPVSRAISMWADNTTRPETWGREDKVKEKVAIVNRFFAFIGKHPVDVTPVDIDNWRRHLEAEGQAVTTVYARISRLSSFYKWLLANPKMQSQVRFNPAVQSRPKYPRPYQSESVQAWTDEQTNAILAVVKTLADSGSVVGKRDYALLLFYVYTGLRRNEVFSLRRKDLAEEDGKLIIKYKRKGGKWASREVCEPDVKQAVKDYLETARGINGQKSSGALWMRHDRGAKRLNGAALDSRTFANNLKKYAKAAGVENVHLHQTRHTYARMVAEETKSFRDTQEALDHENAATTRVYVQRISVKPDKHGRQIAARLKKSSPE
jgi:integrase